MLDTIARVTNKEKGTWVEIWNDDMNDNPFRDWGNEVPHIELGGHLKGAGSEHCPHIVDGEEVSENQYGMWINSNGGVAVPIRAYEHGGVAFSVDVANLSYPFTDQWDSYWAGWAYMTPAEVEREYGRDTPVRERKKRALELIKSAIRLLDAYYNGQVYGIALYGPDGEVVDSIGGYYDTYDKWEDMLSDMASNFPDEYREMIMKCDCGHLDPLEVKVTRRVIK